MKRHIVTRYLLRDHHCHVAKGHNNKVCPEVCVCVLSVSRLVSMLRSGSTYWTAQSKRQPSEYISSIHIIPRQQSNHQIVYFLTSRRPPRLVDLLQHRLQPFILGLVLRKDLSSLASISDQSTLRRMDKMRKILCRSFRNVLFRCVVLCRIPRCDIIFQVHMRFGRQEVFGLSERSRERGKIL